MYSYDALNWLQFSYPQAVIFPIYFMIRAIILGILGALLGSFAAALTYRLPWQIFLNDGQYHSEKDDSSIAEDREHHACDEITKHLRLIKTHRSHCPQCLSPIPYYHNIPIISFLVLRGKAACCGKPIASRYWQIELIMVSLYALIGIIFPFSWITIAYLVITFFVVCLYWTDKEHFLLPDILTLVLLWIGLLFNLVTSFVALDYAVLGAVIGYSILWGVNKLFTWLKGYEGLGRGDMKYFAAIGAWVGLQYIFWVLTLAAILAIFIFLIKAVLNTHIFSKKMRLTDTTTSDDQLDKPDDELSTDSFASPIAFGMYLSISFYLIFGYLFFLSIQASR